MQNNSTHAMFPGATHDEQAMQSFIRTLRVHVLREFQGGGRDILEQEIEPALRKANSGRPPTRKQLRETLGAVPHQRWWSSMLRVTQEMLYDTVGPSIERQLPELIDKARALRGRQGSLTLDPTLPMPRYLTAVDIHSKPGSYQQELAQDDVFPGAEFDRTYRLYSMGMYGPNLDASGWSLIAWIKRTYPDFRPKRILDMGCTVGHSTLPYAEAFGDDVEVHAIDVAAPCLRYAHARAVAMGRTVHFSQQDAERTKFPDGSFDLVVSHLLMHETSHAALRGVVKESERLLAPGGVMAHSDGVRPQDLFSKYYAEWMAHFNNEPFLGTVQDEPFEAICEDAGFAPESVTVAQAPLRRREDGPDAAPLSSFLVVSARKSRTRDA
jgi:ubiquinone/menaquinone biosynthesis C-methylase UbiE